MAGQPTNSDILKEIKGLKAMQIAQSKDIAVLMNWKISEDAYRAALAKVKRDEEQTKYNGLRDDNIRRRTELVKQAGIVLGLIAAILYAYAAIHGVKTP